jgi:hypothetical protein
LNSGRRGGKPAINRLSYGAALTVLRTSSWFLAWLYPSFLKKKGIYSSEIAGEFEQATQRYIPDDSLTKNMVHAFIDDMVSSAEHMASNDSVINANVLKWMWRIEFGA